MYTNAGLPSLPETAREYPMARRQPPGGFGTALWFTFLPVSAQLAPLRGDSCDVHPSLTLFALSDHPTARHPISELQPDGTQQGRGSDMGCDGIVAPRGLA